MSVSPPPVERTTDQTSSRAAKQSPKLLFIRLGSGRATPLGIGNKGALLDRAAWSGLPVPRGLILLDAAWHYLLARQLIQIQDQTVTVPQPAALLAALQLPAFDRPLAIRSAFSAEDRSGESLAGFFTSRLFIDPADPAALAEALSQVWSSAFRREGSFRRDVLLMEMVEAEQAGVAFTESRYEDDLINYTHGTADRLVAGQERGQSAQVPQLRSWESPTSPGWLSPQTGDIEQPPAWLRRLQRLLKHVRREFGRSDWDIEWADDGRYCWLVQIRPVTRSPRRNEAFTGANLNEILPALPSRFITSLIASCAGNLFDYYRQFDPELPTGRPIIELFYGRPFFNLSLLTEMMRRWGLPARLVTGSIGGQANGTYGLNVGRFLSKMSVLLSLGRAQLSAVASARQTSQAILARAEQPGRTLSEGVENLRWLFSSLVTEMFSLTAAMSGPLLLLREAGTLAEHNARQQTIATQMYTDLAPLRAMAAEEETIRAALASGQLPDDPEFRRRWQAYLAKHGHRGVYESDIARPRLHEAPEPLLASLAQPVTPRPRPPRRSLRGWLTWPLWWQAGRTMRAREELRYNAMIGFDRIRRRLQRLAKAYVMHERLPAVEALWLLDINEVRALDQGWVPDKAFFEQRRAEVAHLEAFQLPELFHRFDDLAQYRAGEAAGSAEERLRGLSLTEGDVRGRAWVLTEPDTRLPADFDSAKTILVARSVDAGWIPTFGQVAGAVVESGGDLSHGSIILREIGLPAITNVRGVTRIIQTGDPLHLRAGQGLVERLTTSRRGQEGRG